MTQGVSILALPVRLSAVVAANRFLTVAGALAVAADVSIGVGRTAGVAGELVTATVHGTEIVEAGAAFDVGAVLGSDAQGRAVAATGIKRGLALQAATGAGSLVEVLLVPALA
jgi:hypothetical protein